MPTIDMEPCPFCGNEQVVFCDESATSFFYCTACGMCGPRAHDRILAADRWNGLPRRTEIERLERERDWIISKMEFMPCYRGRCPYPPEKEREVCMKTNKLQCWKDAAEKEISCPKN